VLTNRIDKEGKIYYGIMTILISMAIIFIIHSWIVTDGLPYHSDANESFSAYVQGQNMLNFDPLKNAFLPDDAPAKHEGAHPFTYTHGPNLPRYFSYIMTVLGIKSLGAQILLSSIGSLLLSVWFILKSFPEVIYSTKKGRAYHFSFLIIALFCLDFLGTLQFIVNLWRTWHFPLFWGCVWAVRAKPRKPIVFLLYYLLFQLEFLFALFTLCSCFGYYIWDNRINWKKGFGSTGFMIVVASISSLVTFIAQLIIFYGFKGFLFDLKTTYIARNTNTIEWNSISDFYEAHSVMMWPSTPSWDFHFSLFLKVTFENLLSKLSPTIAFLFLSSLLVSFFLLIISKRYSWTKKQLLFKLNTSLSPLLWSTVITYLLLGLTIPGYTLNGYVHRWAPLLIFPVILALALLVVNLLEVIMIVLKSKEIKEKLKYYFIPTFSIFILTLWIVMSVNHYQRYPHFVHTPAKILSTKYKGHSFVSGTTFPHMISHYTGKWAYYSPTVFPGDLRLDQTHNWNADRNKNTDYEIPEYYLCEVLPYNGYLNCDEIAKQMVDLGHILVESEIGYRIIKLNWRLPVNKVSS